MSFSVVIRCGRDWTPGDPCRQAEPVGVVDSFAGARATAARAGWSTVVEAGTEGDVIVDRCPACTRRELEGGTRRRGTDRRPVADLELPAGRCTMPCCRPARRVPLALNRPRTDRAPRS